LSDVSILEACNRIAKLANLTFGVSGEELIFSGN